MGAAVTGETAVAVMSGRQLIGLQNSIIASTQAINADGVSHNLPKTLRNHFGVLLRFILQCAELGSLSSFARPELKILFRLGNV